MVGPDALRLRTFIPILPLAHGLGLVFESELVLDVLNRPNGLRFLLFVFIDASRKSEDEGPLSDILNVQVTPLAEGGVHVGQGPYVRKLLDEYLDQIIAELPNPAEPGARHSNNTPFTLSIAERVQAATDDTSERELRVVRLFQSCLGALLYLVSNTRPDIITILPFPCGKSSNHSPT